MPNKNTPPKHKTQNSRLVTYVHTYWNHKRNCERTITTHSWQPVPLRSTRKDLP